MKKRNNYLREKKVQEISDIGFDEYIEMFDEGYSDTEISKELGINEKYIKRLREEYQSDF